MTKILILDATRLNFGGDLMKKFEDFFSYDAELATKLGLLAQHEFNKHLFDTLNRIEEKLDAIYRKDDCWLCNKRHGRLVYHNLVPCHEIPMLGGEYDYVPCLKHTIKKEVRGTPVADCELEENG